MYRFSSSLGTSVPVAGYFFFFPCRTFAALDQAVVGCNQAWSRPGRPSLNQRVEGGDQVSQVRRGR
eukprot:6485734-Amphidinium_carterae.1